MEFQNKIKLLRPYRHLLTNSKIGLEREGLRVNQDDGIAQTPHPKIFGSALTHNHITTDFAESLLELITPAGQVDQTLSFLSDTLHFIYHNLNSDELFWTQSMPCIISKKEPITLAQYGRSNLAELKTVYRRGLGCRYGRTMQLITGIHFNYSYTKDFWSHYQMILGDNQNKQNFINERYMDLIRNLLRFNWLIIYLFGSSPSVCSSFLQNYHQHSLEPFTRDSLYEPFATSLRMGNIGYQNYQEGEIGVNINYNTLAHYTNSLKLAIQTPYSQYQNFNQKRNGKYQQLNANLLQIENEHYASIRPKSNASLSKKPISALNQDGIDYIELRSLDINPLIPLGIDKRQIQFLESLLLFCLLSTSDLITTNEQNQIDRNTHLIAHNGRDPKLKLNNNNQRMSIINWGNKLLIDIKQCAQLLSNDHLLAVSNIGKRLDDSSLTPSQILIDKMRSKNLSFTQLSRSLSMDNKQYYQDQRINQAHFEKLAQLTYQSINNQNKIEQSDTLSFDDYLVRFNEY